MRLGKVLFGEGGGEEKEGLQKGPRARFKQLQSFLSYEKYLYYLYNYVKIYNTLINRRICSAFFNKEA